VADARSAAPREARGGLRASAVSGGLVCALVLALGGLGLLEPLELALYDHYLRRFAAPPEQPSELLLVEIREQDIREQGHWPISDRSLAAALRALLDAGAGAIGLDLYRDLPVAPGVGTFDRLLREEPRVVAVHKFGALDAEGIAGPAALEGSDRIGFNDLLLDRDGVVRRALLYQDDGAGEVEPSFALVLALRALAERGVAAVPAPENLEWLRLGASTLAPFESSDGGYAAADDSGYQILLDHARGTRAFETIGLGALLRGEVAPEQVRGRVVVLGSNAKSLPDSFRVPGGASVPGLELHAEAVDQLLRLAAGTSQPRRTLSDALEAALVLALSLAGCALGLGVPGRPVLGTGALIAAVAGGAAALWLAGGLAFREGVWVPMAAPMLAWIGSAGIVTSWVARREQRERKQVMRLFSRHVSAAVADEIWRRRAEFLAAGRPRPQRLTATVLFVDLRGYTAHAEKMEPEQLMAWSNEFMDRMARMVHQHGGIVDDYFGDGIKACFGVPIARTGEDEIAADARSAAACALAMARELPALSADLQQRGLPPCAAKIGLHTGPAVAGSVGEADRMKYTVVGDVAVTAQRLESTRDVAHDYDAAPCRILLSEAARVLVAAAYRTEPVGEVALEGRAEPVAAHRLLGPLQGV
jgi:adenylate cyclase